jgi:HEPN domain-containing protein
MHSKTDYWLELCDDDIRAAKNLLASKDFMWMGFICHLVAEKAIKAAIADFTDEVPPKIHHLPKLADKANIYTDLNDAQKSLLGKLTPLQIEARYPEYKEKLAATLTENYCAELLKETEAFLCWIKTRLGR